jgi:hypothetical protein
MSRCGGPPSHGASAVTLRARAWLLLILFLGAGTSLPGLDALLFHWRVDPLAGRIHVEPTGGGTDHADHCTLGRTPPGSRAVAALAIVVRHTPDHRQPLRRLPPARAFGARAASPSLPRAPPIDAA